MAGSNARKELLALTETDLMKQFHNGKIVSKDMITCAVIMCVYINVDPHKSTKIVEAESLKEGIISAVKLTKVHQLMVKR